MLRNPTNAFKNYVQQHTLLLQVSLQHSRLVTRNVSYNINCFNINSSLPEARGYCLEHMDLYIHIRMNPPLIHLTISAIMNNE